jgi:fructose-1,6-bisphosphatase
LVEQAGGKATTGSAAILDVVPERLHQRISLVFGSASEVDTIIGYH